LVIEKHLLLNKQGVNLDYRRKIIGAVKLIRGKVERIKGEFVKIGLL
jgi:hypothetical protein